MKRSAPTAMELALAEAAAAARGEVPVGAALLDGEGKMVAADGNRTEELADPTAHAEMLVIRAAAQKLGWPRLPECDLYVTLEPCPMCAQAISFAHPASVLRRRRSQGRRKHGPRIFASSSCHHRPEVYGGIGERRAAELLRRFFGARRA